MQLTYDDIDLLLDMEAETAQETEAWTDRAPHMPLLGFLVASAIALPLWGLIGWAVWALIIN